jgi:hypothetical protein
MCSHSTVDMSISQDSKASLMWNQAISEAKAKIKALRYTIKVYEERRDAGETWPGEVSP